LVFLCFVCFVFVLCADNPVHRCIRLSEGEQTEHTSNPKRWTSNHKATRTFLLQWLIFDLKEGKVVVLFKNAVNAPQLKQKKFKWELISSPVFCFILSFL
jgi:hypothetical protein